MAALKLLNSKSTFSLSQGLRNYFYCCFPSSDSNVSPTRSTEGVLKADDLEKTLSEQAEKEKKENEAKRGEGEEEEEEGDEGSLRRRRSLIADNFGYESDAKDQSDARPPLEISLESCKRTGAPEPTERSRIAEHPSGIQGQGEESKTATAVKKGLNSLLAIAERATAEESTAGDVRQESPGQDSQSANSNQEGPESAGDVARPLSQDAVGPSPKAFNEAERAPSTVSSLSSENKKLSSTDEANPAAAVTSAAVATAASAVPDVTGAPSVSSPVARATGGASRGSNLEVSDATDGHLFDISDLQQNNSAGSSVISSCGSIFLSLSHDSHVNRMSITIKEARDLPSRERGGVNQAQIRTLLLPLRKIRHKTKVVVSSDCASVFNETFECKVPTDELTSMGLRVRLYGCERLRKDRLIGETIINFTHSNTIGEFFWAHLEPRSNLSHGDSLNSISSLTHSESDSSTHSLQHGGALELMLGLAYNGVTGRLSVEVIKGSNFKNAATKRPPDTFVRLELKGPDGERMTHSKTTIRRGHPNPLFKETFMFQVAQSQLSDVSLHVSVFVQKSLKRREMIGWFTMGSTNSTDDDASHWTSMLESKGEQVCKWHALLEP